MLEEDVAIVKWVKLSNTLTIWKGKQKLEKKMSWRPFGPFYFSYTIVCEQEVAKEKSKIKPVSQNPTLFSFI